MDAEKNISQGRKALQKAIRTQSDVRDAMSRDDVGSIDFVWGTPGTGKNFKHGYGLSHIIAKRDAEGGDGKAIADKLVEVIAKGTDTDIQTAKNGSGEYRLRIHHDGYTAVLSSATDKRNAWLLTGWEENTDNKKARVNARGEGYDSTTATAATPTLTRRSGETIASAHSIPQAEEQSNEKNSQATKRAEKPGASSIDGNKNRAEITLENDISSRHGCPACPFSFLAIQ